MVTVTTEKKQEILNINRQWLQFNYLHVKTTLAGCTGKCTVSLTWLNCETEIGLFDHSAH